MSYLAQWYDPEMQIRDGETKATIEKFERERLSKMVAVASAAQSVPRRLGADADSDELAEDKKRCRRVQHAAAQCLKDWGGAVNNVGDVTREAAQVDWAKFGESQQVDLLNRLRYISTWAMNGGDAAFAKTACVRLNNEMRWLQYALR